MGLVKGMFGWSSFWSVAQSGGIPQYEMNIAKYYGMKGNPAFLFGRWGLGSFPWTLPTSHGFGGFYGTMMGHSPSCSSDSEDVFTDAEYFWMMGSHIAPLLIAFTILLITSKMLSFIGFKILVLATFLCFSGTVVFRIYCWMLPLNNITCKLFENNFVSEEFYNDTTLNNQVTQKIIHYLKFRKKPPFLLVVPFHQPGHPAFVSKHFVGKSGINKYYDSILELDWNIGEIMKTVKDESLESSTVVFFLSDNGVVFTDPYKGTKLKHGSKMSLLRGEKGSVLEGGLRVPAIVKWPGLTPPGQETSVVTSIMDIFPTIQYLSGEPNQLQKTHSRGFDGKSLIPLFKNPKGKSDDIHKVLLHYCSTGELSAATVGDYKVFFGYNNMTTDCAAGDVSNPIIYNVKNDPMEMTPLEVTDFHSIVARAKSSMAKFELSMDIKRRKIKSQFDQIPFPWDMWVNTK